MSRIASLRKGSRDASRGFIVVAALWLLAALAALAAGASIYISQSAADIAAFDYETQAEMLESAAMELAGYELSLPATVARPTRGGFTFRLAKSTVAVEYMSEAARLNLNMASRAMIAGLFTSLGAPPEAAMQYADRVAGWRGTPRRGSQDDEIAIYRTAGLNYLPRRAPFNSVDELWLVAGLPPALVERALPFVTVFSGSAEVNVLDAAPEVLAALPGMTPLRLNAFLDARQTMPRDDPQAVLGALGGSMPGVTTRGSDAYRVRMLITLPDGRQSRPEAVISILGAGETQAYRILAWRDEVGTGT
jgi:general secretion pathway protein K